MDALQTTRKHTMHLGYHNQLNSAYEKKITFLTRSQFCSIFLCVDININMLRHNSAWIATFEKSHVPPVAIQSMHHRWYMWRCVRSFFSTAPFGHRWTYVFIQQKYSVERVEYTLKSTLHCCHCTKRSTDATTWHCGKTCYVWCIALAASGGCTTGGTSGGK